MTIFALEQAVSNGCQPCITEVESALEEVAALRADLDRAIVNFGDAAATACDMRAQRAEAQRDLIAKESELDGLRASRIAYAKEFPLNADGEPDVGNVHANIRSLKAQLAEAQKDEGRLNWIDRQTQLPATSHGQPWIIGHTTIFGLDFRAAIDATKGENNGSN